MDTATAAGMLARAGLAVSRQITNCAASQGPPCSRIAESWIAPGSDRADNDTSEVYDPGSPTAECPSFPCSEARSPRWYATAKIRMLQLQKAVTNTCSRFSAWALDVLSARHQGN